MRKIKVSFSLFIAMLMVGMMTVAFAAAPDAPTGIKAEATSLTEATITWTAVPGADDYEISVEGAPAELTGNVTTYNITFANATGVEKIDITLVAKTGVESSPVAKFGFYAHNLPGVMQVVPGDNNLQNGNQTGEGNVIKAVAGHKTHGDYRNNTNSCASCHQTHTAAAAKLLFKSSDYDTCIACHDGTMGYYNVFETDNTKDLGAGTFGGTHAGNMSIHLSNGSVKNAAAPGSNSVVGGDGWATDFTCVSCHDPHGSYSDRLLTSDPNHMTQVDRKQNATEKWWYGNKLNDVPVIDGGAYADKAARTAAIAAWAGGDYNDPAKTGAKAMKFKVDATDVSTGDYKGLGLVANDWIVQLYRWDLAGGTAKWVPTPFMAHGANSGDGIDLAIGVDSTLTNDLNGVSFVSASDGAWKAKVSNSKASANAGWIVNNAKGFIKLYKLTAKGNVAATASADETAALVTYVTNVQAATVTKIPTVSAGAVLPNGLQVTKTDLPNLIGKNQANGYNAFCATCHTDYLTGAKYNADGTGVGTGANEYFHHSMSNSYTCVRCHFAHGTDVTWMQDANSRTVKDLVTTGQFADEDAAKAYLLDVNPTSSLKRFTNMAVCYGCHTSSHSEVIVNSGTFGLDALQANGITTDGTASFLKDNVQDPKVTGQQ